MVEFEKSTEAPKNWPKTVLIAEPRGFCAGVERSIEMYDAHQDAYKEAKGQDDGLGRLVSVGEPAHNADVIARYSDSTTFVKRIDEAEPQDWVIQGPHGTSQRDLEIAEEKGLRFTLTECPLVTRVKRQVAQNTLDGVTTVYLGEKGHEEARAVTEGQNAILVENKEEALAVAHRVKSENPSATIAFDTQTTKNADEALEIAEELRKLHPDIVIPRKEDICYATRDRQLSVKELINQGAEAVIVVGSPTSSNANRLFEVAGQRVPAFLVGKVDEFDIAQIAEYGTIAAHSSASTPEESFQKMLDKLRARGAEVQSIEVRDETGKVIDEKGKVFKPGETIDFSKGNEAYA